MLSFDIVLTLHVTSDRVSLSEANTHQASIIIQMNTSTGFQTDKGGRWCQSDEGGLVWQITVVVYYFVCELVQTDNLIFFITTFMSQKCI